MIVNGKYKKIRHRDPFLLKGRNVYMAKKKYFGNSIEPQCQYCTFGVRAKDGGKVLCEKRGLVNGDSSCSKFAYSPLKRIPVKQLHIPGNFDDDE